MLRTTAGYPVGAKPALISGSLTRLTANELESDRIKVNAVCPGWCRTAMGGQDAPRSADDGAQGIVWAALLPDDGPSGGFFRDGKPIAW